MLLLLDFLNIIQIPEGFLTTWFAISRFFSWLIKRPLFESEPKPFCSLTMTLPLSSPNPLLNILTTSRRRKLWLTLACPLYHGEHKDHTPFLPLAPYAGPDKLGQGKSVCPQSMFSTKMLCWQLWVPFFFFFFYLLLLGSPQACLKYISLKISFYLNT